MGNLNGTMLQETHVKARSQIHLLKSKGNNKILLVAKKKTSAAKRDSIPETQLLVSLIPFLNKVESFFFLINRVKWKVAVCKISNKIQYYK